MSSLLRSPGIRRAFSVVPSRGPHETPIRRAPSPAAQAFEGEAEATTRRGLPLPTVPRSHPCGSLAPGGGASNLSPDQIDKVLREVQEVEKLVQQNVDEFLDLYREMRTVDHGYFERFLTKCGVPRSKFRDDFIWRCKLAAIFTASGMAGHLSLTYQ